jgi:hypothetical protein
MTQSYATRNAIEILRKQRGARIAKNGGSGHAEPRRCCQQGRRKAVSVVFGGGVMRVQRGHWLDYDPVALAVLVIGIGIVMLVALSI